MDHQPSPTPGVRSGFAQTDDGVRLHWRAVGQGPLLACCNGVGVSTFFWKYLVEHFRDRYTVILWDYRGHGRSDRDLDPRKTDLSIARHADDLATVLDAVDPTGQPAVVAGHSMGCQVALELYRRTPDRVKALILALGTAGRALQTFNDDPRSLTMFKLIRALIRIIGPTSNEIARPVLESPLAWWVTRRLHLVDPIYTQREDMVPYMTHLASLDMRLFIEAVMQIDRHDAWSVIPTLDRPVLVIAAELDSFTPMWCSAKIAEEAPQGELLVLAGASHAALIEQPDTINHRIDRFLTEHTVSASGAPPRP